MNGSKFSNVSHEKYIGININNDLRPNKHCSDVMKKAYTL